MAEEKIGNGEWFDKEHEKRFAKRFIQQHGDETAIYKLTFPAIVYVKAKTENEAKKIGADRAGFNYFTTYQDSDCLSIEIVQTMKECPMCKFYIIPKEQNVCYYCR